MTRKSQLGEVIVFTLLYILCNCFALPLSSCKSKKSIGITEKGKTNLEAMHGIRQCFIEKDFSKLGNYVDVDCLDHSGDQGDLKGLDKMRAEYEKWAPMFDITKSEVIKEMADDEYAFVWVRFTGTMKMKEMGMKPGTKFSKTDVEVARFKDGKVVEHWTFIEPMDMKQVVPAKTTTVNGK